MTAVSGIINPHAAAKAGDLRLLQIYGERGGNLNLRDEDSFTPAHFSANYGYRDALEYILSKGGDVNCSSRFGSVPLHFAAEHGRVDIIKLLLSQRANVDPKNTDQATPLHFAAQRGHLEACDVLIDHGADLNAQTSKGNTPLHYSTFFGRLKIVGHLIKRGADISIKNSAGKLPGVEFLRTVPETRRAEIRALLKLPHPAAAQTRGTSLNTGVKRLSVTSPADNSNPEQTQPTHVDGTEGLKQQVADLQATVAQLRTTVQQRDAQIVRLSQRMALLEASVAQQSQQQQVDTGSAGVSTTDTTRGLPHPPAQSLQVA